MICIISYSKAKQLYDPEEHKEKYDPLIRQENYCKKKECLNDGLSMVAISTTFTALFTL
jgi:hypothetical protein